MRQLEHLGLTEHHWRSAREIEGVCDALELHGGTVGAEALTVLDLPVEEVLGVQAAGRGEDAAMTEGPGAELAAFGEPADDLSASEVLGDPADELRSVEILEAHRVAVEFGAHLTVVVGDAAVVADRLRETLSGELMVEGQRGAHGGAVVLAGAVHVYPGEEAAADDGLVGDHVEGNAAGVIQLIKAGAGAQVLEELEEHSGGLGLDLAGDVAIGQRPAGFQEALETGADAAVGSEPEEIVGESALTVGCQAHQLACLISGAKDQLGAELPELTHAVLEEAELVDAAARDPIDQAQGLAIEAVGGDGLDVAGVQLRLRIGGLAHGQAGAVGLLGAVAVDHQHEPRPEIGVVQDVLGVRQVVGQPVQGPALPVRLGGKGPGRGGGEGVDLIEAQTGMTKAVGDRPLDAAFGLRVAEAQRKALDPLEALELDRHADAPVLDERHGAVVTVGETENAHAGAQLGARVRSRKRSREALDGV
jgi:hypothetical protein